jgi:hypothetical protein
MKLNIDILKLGNAIFMALLLVVLFAFALERRNGNHYVQIEAYSDDTTSIELVSIARGDTFDKMSSRSIYNQVLGVKTNSECQILILTNNWEDIKIKGARYQFDWYERYWSDPSGEAWFKLREEQNSKDLNKVAHFNSRDIIISPVRPLLVRGSIYILLFLGSFWLFNSLISISTGYNIKQYFLFQLIALSTGIITYTVFRNLWENPNRTELNVKWEGEAENVYGIQYFTEPGKTDSRSIMVNPGDEYAIPISLKMEEPYHTIALSLDGTDKTYNLRAVEIENSIFKVRFSGEELIKKGAFFHRSILTESEDEKISFNAYDTKAYLQIPGQNLTWYRAIDRLLYRAHYFMAFSVWSFVFFFLLKVCNQKRVGGKFEIMFILLFLAIIFLPGLIWLVSSPSHYFSEEKRPAAISDSIYSKKLDKWPSSINNYLSDHFGGRNLMILLSNAYKVILFDETGDLSPIKIGEESWMFYQGEQIGEFVKNRKPLTDKELKKIARNLQERNHWITQHGSDYYLFFVPLKHTVYSDKLPESMKPENSPSKLDQVISYLRDSTDLRFYDARKTLEEARKENEIYYRRDSHWNFLGAYYGYEMLIDSMSSHYPQLGSAYPLKDFKISRYKNNEGDLTSLIGLNNLLPRKEVLIVPNFPTDITKINDTNFKDITFKYAPLTYQNNMVENDFEVYVYRDSYSNYLIPYLNLHIYKASYLWSHDFNEKVYKNGYPDFVIHEIMERFIVDLMKPNSPKVQDYYQTHLDTISTCKLQ